MKILVRSKSPPTETGARGSICVDRKNHVYLILPGNVDSSLVVMRTRKGDAEFEPIWISKGFDGEPLVDVQRLEDSDVLSIFTRTVKDRSAASQVVVLEFNLK